jgi:uncharacterized protein (DUF885 family)
MTRNILTLVLTTTLFACAIDTKTKVQGPPLEQAQPGIAQARGGKVSAEVSLQAAAKLNALYGEYWQEQLKRNPLRATQIGDPRYNDVLIDSGTQGFRDQEAALLAQYLRAATAIGPQYLTTDDQLSYELFVYQLQRAQSQAQYPNWQMPINQFRSLPQQLTILGSGQGAQPFKTVADYENWLKRAAAVPTLLNTQIANMRIGVQNGNTQPQVLMQKVLPQLAALINDKAEDSLFWRPISMMPSTFAPAEKARLRTAYKQLIEATLTPAFKSMHAFVRDEYLPKCRRTTSFSALPNGAAWYADLVKQQTTTALSPAEIHQIGLAEVARIHAQMRALQKQIGVAGDLPELFAYYQNEKKFEFAKEAELLAAYNAFRSRVEIGLPKLFRLTPKAPFEIRPVEAFRAASAAGGQYNGPSQDGTRPGIFYVNTYDLPARKTWDMESLFLHEAIPGHHFQIALMQEQTNLPEFRRFGGETAFSEGWGLYAESLGKELGVYTDTDQYFGRLQAELWRSIRLVVDTGLHSKNWSREQVIDYMLKNSASNLTEATSETERYIAIPGQALAYKIGELRILALRAQAEKALGANFDVREFHAQMLQDGSLPLPILEAKMVRWIEAQK